MKMIIEVNMYKNEYYCIHNVDTFKKDDDELYIFAGMDTNHEVRHCFYMPDIKSILITIDE